VISSHGAVHDTVLAYEEGHEFPTCGRAGMTNRMRAKIKGVVRQSYDAIAEEFLEWTQGIRLEEREKYTSILFKYLASDAQVLELGCGAGVPTTQKLAECFQVTGVDISSRQIELARTNVPNAEFLCADMMQLALPPASFDAVTAFYSVVHVPREEQPELFGNIHRWLRPGGLLVATLGVNAEDAGYEDNWLGAPMYWSSFDGDTNRRMIEEAGFQIISAVEETALEDDEAITFLWVVAQKSE
jgi:ubiquinone/menaquinone biosynthesis C-methylase UbiE